MASKKLNPQAPDLSALIEGLSEAGIEYIIVGGLAAVAQGAPVTTFDLTSRVLERDQDIFTEGSTAFRPSTRKP